VSCAMRCVVATFPLAIALDNGLARTPAMGYNSWYDVLCGRGISEEIMKYTADAMVSTGLRDAGYTYLNLDDCWAKGRHENGTVFADTNSFPSGTLKPLADYVHSRGMLFGTYSDRGTKTCAGRPGAQGFEEIDAQTYASWGVDYLKEDSCSASDDHNVAFQQYAKMRDALNATGRPILFSLCGWNDWYAPVGASLGNSYRIGPDDTNWPGILKNIDIMSGLEQYAGPGGWNDPCLLLSKSFEGELTVSELQSRAQFSMWAVLAAPLLISGSVLNMSQYVLDTYLNKDVIAVSQDPLGKQGLRIAGGNLSTEDVVATVTTCSGRQEQQWTWDSPKKGYIQAVTGGCLSVADCDADIILWPECPTSGCCEDCANMVFEMSENGTIKSGQKGDYCVAVKDSQLELQLCGSNHAVWRYDNKSRSLRHQFAPDYDLCVGVSAGGTNVWGRHLANGSVAVVFLNVSPSPTDVVCDEGCFGQIGVKKGEEWKVRDLWNSSAVLPNIVDATFTASMLPADGGHMMIVVSKTPEVIV